MCDRINKKKIVVIDINYYFFIHIKQAKHLKNH